jgi:hypothetical protein
MDLGGWHVGEVGQRHHTDRQSQETDGNDGLPPVGSPGMHSGRNLEAGSMSTTCTRCQATGFLNIDQVPEELHDKGYEAIENWMEDTNAERDRIGGCSCHMHPPCGYCLLGHDVVRCDCCGDGDGWFGTPGEHYNKEDPQGSHGPYASNGGLAQCH